MRPPLESPASRWPAWLLLAVSGLAPAPAPWAAPKHARPAAHAARPAADPRQAEQAQAELRALRERIERVTREVGQDALERDRLAQNLRTAELAVAGARHDLDALRAREAAHLARRAGLAAQREQARATLARERDALAQQLRVAYQTGNDEPLRLLLNQRDPAQASRMLAWYGYFGRARAAQIDVIAAQARQIDLLDAALAEQEAALQQVRRGSQQQLAQLETGRDARQNALLSLQGEARSRAASLARLQAQRGDLERLLRELSRVVPRASAPADLDSAFGQLRGRLPWPVAGSVVAGFGEQRASGVNWDGLVLATERGAPVRAVAAGRMIYADWLPGLGLLAIIDHGEGYLSLYGYNDQLRKSAGEAVAAGEVIAAAGDSGGRAQPQLYFEIRHAGRPFDPRPWFRRRTPD